MLRKDQLAVATEWLRAYANASQPSNGPFRYSAGELRAKGISVVALLSMFRSAHVISVNMNDDSDGQKGVWTVVGFDSEECPLRVVVLIETEEMSVEILSADWDLSAKWAENGTE